MERKLCTVYDILNHFKYQHVTGDEASLQRQVYEASTSRPGLELTGFYNHVELKRVIIVGNKESAYIKGLDEETQRARFDFLTNKITPVIIITGNNECPPILKEIAVAKNFPILLTADRSSEVMVDIITFLDEKLAPTTNIHGVLMNVFGKGVLIIGESGMGKSEVALELILKGHSLIADDRVDVYVVRDKVMGTAPELLRGLLEIRGIGIIDVTQMFGVRAFLEQEHIDFVIEFQKWDQNNQYRRIGIEEQLTFEVLNESLPKLVFPVKEGRDLAVLVESGVRDFMLKQRGFNAAETFDQRVMDLMIKKNEENV